VVVQSCRNVLNLKGSGGGGGGEQHWIKSTRKWGNCRGPITPSATLIPTPLWAFQVRCFQTKGTQSHSKPLHTTSMGRGGRGGASGAEEVNDEMEAQRNKRVTKLH
jgi:hypothetical protein